MMAKGTSQSLYFERTRSMNSPQIAIERVVTPSPDLCGIGLFLGVGLPLGLDYAREASADRIDAFSNPVLIGPSGNDKRAWQKQHCAPPATTRLAEAGGIAGRGVAAFRRSQRASRSRTSPRNCRR